MISHASALLIPTAHHAAAELPRQHHLELEAARMAATSFPRLTLDREEEVEVYLQGAARSYLY